MWTHLSRVNALDRAPSKPRAARRYELRAKAYSLVAADIDVVTLPAIAHWKGDHFVVVEECTTGHVRIVDPARGRQQLTRARFAQSFSGVAITLSPNVGFRARPSTARADRARFFGHLVRTPGVPRALAYVIAVSFALQALGLAVPLLTKVVVDDVLPARQLGLLSILGMGMAAVVLAQAISTYIRAHLLVRLQKKLDAKLMAGFFQHLLALPFRFFQERTSGDLLARMNGNTVLRQVVTGQMVSVVMDGALLIMAAAVLLVMTPAFGLTVFACGALQAALMLLAASRTQTLLQAELALHADAYGFTAETLKGIAGLKASGGEARALERWTSLYDAYLTASLERGRYGAGVDALMSIVRSGAPVLLLVVGATAVLGGTMTLGTMLGASAIAAAFLGPLASLVASGQQVQLAIAHFERLADVFAAIAEPRRHGREATRRITGSIELRDVGFRYAASSPWIFRHVNLSVRAGEKLAVVGRTGSGKSTLAAMLLFLYEPTEGEILFDGVPGTAIDYTALRQQFGVVLQEPFMLSGSIRSNVAFHCPGLSPERVIAACQLAGVHEDIIALPMGYDTRLAEAGTGLSGGQRQRLSLARALASEPSVLLLDEATSHLDSITEARVDENLSTLSCTRIVIAHRLSTVRNADRIIVIDGGGIAETGTHQELLDRGGAYAALVGSSALGALADADR